MSALREEILSLLARQQDEARQEATARRKLRKLGLILHRRHGYFTVADHLGVPEGAPYRTSIDAVLLWLDGGAR